MISDEYHFAPKPDERSYEEAIERAHYLIDRGFIHLTSGQTEEQIVEHLARMIAKQKLEAKLENE